MQVLVLSWPSVQVLNCWPPLKKKIACVILRKVCPDVCIEPHTHTYTMLGDFSKTVNDLAHSSYFCDHLSITPDFKERCCQFGLFWVALCRVKWTLTSSEDLGRLTISWAGFQNIKKVIYKRKEKKNSQVVFNNIANTRNV